MTPAGVAAMARAHPDKVALVSGGTRWTFRDLDRRANRAARAFAARGVDADSVVGVALRNRAEFFEAAIAAARRERPGGSVGSAV
jgi:non-ribosomal peptide synthetase component E (peptide arylation enzyme)